MKGVQGRSGMELGGVRDVVAWVEVTSRVFRYVRSIEVEFLWSEFVVQLILWT